MRSRTRRHAALRRVSGLGLILAGAAGIAHPGCIARSDAVLRRVNDDADAGPAPVRFLEGGAPDVVFDVGRGDPHGVLGIDPGHGPFSGGTRAIVRGNGFTSDVRVFFGATLVPKAETLAVDPHRVQVVVPAGAPGLVDVTTENAGDRSTRRTLEDGYAYDSFYVDPSTGPSAGGTRVTLYGAGTRWDDRTRVFIDLAPCEVLGVREASGGSQELDCLTPPGAPGSKPVRVTTGDGTSVDVLDAFTYGDSQNGFLGGLSGEPLASSLRVIVLDTLTGNVVPSALVILGDDATSAVKADDRGVAIVAGDGLGPTRTVTVVAECHQPMTFVDVPVDTVTAYLDPVLSPACAKKGDPPSVGGSAGSGSKIRGELVWEGAVEFKRSDWTNVPAPASSDARKVAYVFELADDPTTEFRLPSASEGVTTEAPGTIGYEFEYAGGVGNLTLYAVAGVENREVDPPLFTAYAMGLVKGVSGAPAGTTSDVYISVDNTLDHSLTLEVAAPRATSRGPDRLRATVAVRVGNSGYAILPGGARTALLPVTSPLVLVGLPPLKGTLAGTEYVSTAEAVTGESGTTPVSVIGLVASTSTSEPIPLDRFLDVPLLVTPGDGGSWNGRDLELSADTGGATNDPSLLLVEIQWSAGLSSWTVVAPAGVTSIRLPDLAGLGLGPERGPVTFDVTVARVDGFDYGSLSNKHLGSRGWDAFASDVFHAYF